MRRARVMVELMVSNDWDHLAVHDTIMNILGDSDADCDEFELLSVDEVVR